MIMKKCRCGKPGVYWEPCENKFYCKRCLSRKLERKFKRNVKESNLFQNKKIAVAISGGADSSVLLYLLHSIMKHRKNDLIPILIDEGISGYRDKSMKKAKQLCEKLELDLHMFSFKNEFGITMDEVVKKINKLDNKICTYCGILRRYILNKKARELKADVICIGHNLEDEAESILMNFFRGDLDRFERLGLISGVVKSKKFVPRVKPLRNVSANEIRVYAKIKGIPFYAKECKYSYDNFRRDLLMPLQKLEKKYPGLHAQILNFYDKLKPKLNIVVKGKIGTCKKCGEPSSGEKCKVCLLLERLR